MLHAPLAVRADHPAELLDLAARVHYGFYHGDARAIEVAVIGLDRLGDSLDVRYYRDFAALRLAQLETPDRDGVKRLRTCAEREIESELEGPAAAEAWVLVAACAFVAGDGRRVDEALSVARGHDDDHPRIALIEAWMLQRKVGSDAERADALGATLTAVVAAFDAWTPSIDDPDWGHAEALAALGKHALAHGEVRLARDLIERSLLVAPDYRLALELRAAMQDNHGGNRAP